MPHTPGHISAFLSLSSKYPFPSTLAYDHGEIAKWPWKREAASQVVAILKFGKLTPFLLGLQSPLVWKWAGSNPGGCIFSVKTQTEYFHEEKRFFGGLDELAKLRRCVREAFAYQKCIFYIVQTAFDFDFY